MSSAVQPSSSQAGDSSQSHVNKSSSGKWAGRVVKFLLVDVPCWALQLPFIILGGSIGLFFVMPIRCMVDKMQNRKPLDGSIADDKIAEDRREEFEAFARLKQRIEQAPEDAMRQLEDMLSSGNRGTDAELCDMLIVNMKQSRDISMMRTTSAVEHEFNDGDRMISTRFTFGPRFDMETLPSICERFFRKYVLFQGEHLFDKERLKAELAVNIFRSPTESAECGISEVQRVIDYGRTIHFYVSKDLQHFDVKVV